MKKMFVPMIGRLGNLLFIYAYARAYAEQNGYSLCIPPWVGERVFNIPEADRTPSHSCDIVCCENYRQSQDDLIYTRQQVKSWLQFRPEILTQLHQLDQSQPEIILNVREGDDYSGFARVSRESYINACRKFGFDPEKAAWETDTQATRMPQFTVFAGNEWGSGLGTSAVGIPSFYRLMKAKVLFRANSTFSWWAATLSDGRIFSPVVEGLSGSPRVTCDNFVEGNWPAMTPGAGTNTDLHLKES
jgi:hypothetical protein